MYIYGQKGECVSAKCSYGPLQLFFIAITEVLEKMCLGDISPCTTDDPSIHAYMYMHVGHLEADFYCL